jgi:hypothetical protein
VEAALAELEQLEPSTLTEGELHRVVVEFQELAARLASVRARFVAEWDEQGAWSSNGSKQAWGRLARECSLSPTAAKLEVRRAKRLRTMPATAAAFAEGKLSVDQVDLLVGANQPALAAVFERDEQLLRDELVGLRYPEARRFIEYWIDQAYDEIGKDRSRPGEAGRHLYAARTFNGTVDVRAHFDPLAGTEYLSALGCIEHELFEDDWAVARAEHGRDAVPSQLPRTAAQRRADAQIVMARRAQAYRHGKHRLPRPLLTVHVGLDALRRMCELADGTVVSPSQLFPRLATDSRTRPVRCRRAGALLHRRAAARHRDSRPALPTPVRLRRARRRLSDRPHRAIRCGRPHRAGERALLLPAPQPHADWRPRRTTTARYRFGLIP